MPCSGMVATKSVVAWLTSKQPMSPEVAIMSAVEALLCLATDASIVDRGGVPCRAVAWLRGVCCTIHSICFYYIQLIYLLTSHLKNEIVLSHTSEISHKLEYLTHTSLCSLFVCITTLGLLVTKQHYIS